MFRWFANRVDPFQPYETLDDMPPSLARFFLAMIWPVRWVVLMALVFGGAVALLEMLMFRYVQRLVDILGETTPADLWATHGTEIAVMAFIALFLRPIVDFIAINLINLTYLTPVAALVRWRTHRHVLRQSVGFFQNDFAGRIAQKIIQTGPAVGDAVYTVIDALWYSSIFTLGALFLLAEADWRMTIPFLVWLAAYIALATYIVPRSGRAAHAMSEARSAMTGRIVDSYTNIQTVKLFAHSDREDAYARESIHDTYTTFQDQMRLVSLMEAGLLILNTALIAGVCGMGLWLWSMGEIGVGAVAASTAVMLRISAMTTWIMWSLTQLFQNIGVAMEGYETIARARAVVDIPDAKPLAVTQGRIAFREMRFMYGRAVGGVRHVDMTVEPGQRVGLIGRSGAGKSSLVNLLLRFYDLEKGRIEIDGQDIARVTQDSLRANISVVTQDTALLHRSVMDNILYGRPDATPEQAREAAERARAHDFILDLSDPAGRTGYDAHVGERGVKLSGGQRQRIAIARAILKDAPILVLDEATSALDSEVEAEIQHELADLMTGKTVIAIAHRLSTIAHLDRIIVMDDGRIVEDGSHAALLERDGLYAGFWKRQSGGFLGVAAE